MTRAAGRLSLFAVGIVACTSGCMSTDEESVFTWARGIEKTDPFRSHNADPTTDSEFVPFSKGIVHEDGFTFFTVPRSEGRMNYRYVGLGPFDVKPMHRYAMRFRIAKCGFPFSPMFCATFLDKHDKDISFETLLHVDGGLDMTLLEEDFGSPPGAAKMIVWVGASMLGKGTLRTGKTLAFSDFGIYDRGVMDGNADTRALRGKHLLSLASFQEREGGPFKHPDFYSGYKGRWLKTEIVKQGDNKVLHIVKDEQGYQYPYFEMTHVPCDNTWLEFSFRIKGKGTIAPGIWWKAPRGTWRYWHGKAVELTDQWQTVSCRRGCTEATAIERGAVDIHVRSKEADIYVDDLSLKVIQP